MDPVKNFGRVIVSAGYNAAATSITLSAGQGARLPDPAALGAFNLTWWNATDYGDATDDPMREIVRVTARSGDVLTVARAQEGTSAVDHDTPGKTYKMELALTAKIWNDLVALSPVRVDDILDGPSSYKRVSIAGVTSGSDYDVCWGTNDQTDPAVNYSPPIGGLYVSEVGSGYIDVRSNALEVVDRKIKLKVWL